jgi:hypothetical protein
MKVIPATLQAMKINNRSHHEERAFARAPTTHLLSLNYEYLSYTAITNLPYPPIVGEPSLLVSLIALNSL